MENNVFEAKELTKQYKNTTALDGIDLTLRQGRIYGLIGNNGAGKTTLMRIMMGLSFPTSGEISLFGQTGKHQLEKARKRIGSLIEAPAVQENLSAHQNLEYERISSGIPDRKQTDELLRLLQISPDQVGNGSLRTFSVGMRQRYGLAAAMLGKPEFLVLDEPTSGVDPDGTRELLALFRRLNQENGVTILISSHILSELYQVATDFVILDHGRIIRMLTHEEAEVEHDAFETVDDYFLSLIHSGK